MKYLFLLIVVMHGLIHLLGFFKAFGIMEIEELQSHPSKMEGVIWLLTALGFAVGFFQYYLVEPKWTWVLLSAAIVSQILIFMAWKDAKYGSLANLIIIMVAVSWWASHCFEDQFRKDVITSLSAKSTIQKENITESDIAGLPSPVQQYLRYVGVIGQPRIHNMHIIMDGEMRSRDQGWFDFSSEQFNTVDDPTRYFFMKAKLRGFPVIGYHAYHRDKASMHVKLLSLIPVVSHEEKIMFPSETVTYFNDLCIFAPGALINPDIEWDTIDDLTAKARFTNAETSITATLYFNELGQLINFVSDDRYDVGEMKSYRFSTPLSDYRKIGNLNLCSYGEAMWHYPEGKFTYGKFRIREVEYNVHVKSSSGANT